MKFNSFEQQSIQPSEKLDRLIISLNKLNPDESHNTELIKSIEEQLYGEDNLIDNSNYNLVDKISTVSKFNETLTSGYLCEYFGVGLPGELEKNIQACEKETLDELVEKIEKKSISEILSITKMLLSFTQNEDKNISQKAKYLIDLIKDKNKSPILSFVCNIDESTKEIIEESLQEESNNFPLYYEYLEGPHISSVSSDYVSVIDSYTHIPFAIAKKDEAESYKKIKENYKTKSYEKLTTEKDFNPLGNEDFSHLIKFLHTPEIRWHINKQLGIKVESLALREQIYFLKFLSTSDKETFAKLEKLLKNKSEKENNSFLRTFLSMSGNEKMGDKILELGEKLPEDVTKKIFAKFGEIIDSVDEVVNVIEDRFGKKTDDPLIMNSIRESLLKKGSDLLIESSEMASKCSAEKECLEIGKTILEKLENSKHSAILLGSAFKSVLKEGANLNQIKDVTLESTNNKEELANYKKEMIKIFEENRINYPKELLKETLNEFEEAIENPENKEFFILKDKEDIIAFMRFDDLPNGNLYAGSLNSLNEIHGLAIGGALLKELLIKKSKENNIEAVVYEKNPMLKKYTTEYGFKITDEIENYKNTGQKFYKIEINKGSLKN